MKLAICLFKYFPFGGLQRDFLKIAKECVRRGHEVHVYTTEWEGELDPSLKINKIKVKGWQNHTRSKRFIEHLTHIKESKEKYDLIIGFNKMPGLDVYYAADPCYQSKNKKQRGILQRYNPRYHQMIKNERAVFDSQSSTKILLIASKQKKEFQKYYQTQDERFFLLPPGVDKDRIPKGNKNEIRQRIRQEWNITSDESLMLMIGSGFKTKGLDRILEGMAALPDGLKKKSKLFVLGKDKKESFERIAQRLGIDSQVSFLGGRHDVPDFLSAADLLLHPAYSENTGTVLLEALVSGVPVLTTDTCGYADYVKSARGGIVLNSPFNQAEFNEALKHMLTAPERYQWGQNGLTFGKTADIYNMPSRAVDILESLK